VRDTGVRLEEDEAAAERRDVRQPNRFRVGLLGTAADDRRDVADALRDVARREQHLATGRVGGSVRLASRDGFERVRRREASRVALDEAGAGERVSSAEAPEDPELAAVALLPLRVEVQQRGDEPPVLAGVVHVADSTARRRRGTPCTSPWSATRRAPGRRPTRRAPRRACRTFASRRAGASTAKRRPRRARGRRTIRRGRRGRCSWCTTRRRPSARPRGRRG
jgi:hypothetical protein